jgi:hypothetical protein
MPDGSLVVPDLSSAGPSLPADEGLAEFALVEVQVAVTSRDGDEQVVVLRADQGRGGRRTSQDAVVEFGESAATLAKVPPVVEDTAIGPGRDEGGGVT